MARHLRYALFATPIGECALAWNEVGLTGVWLPTIEPRALRRKLLRACEGACATAPSREIAELVNAITRLLEGERVAFAAVRLDLSETAPFDRRVYEATRSIAVGSVLTYGEVAARVGNAASARAVGQSLGRNPWPLVVPCHRVVASGNSLGGFSAPGGAATKRRLLAIEGARRAGAPDLFDLAGRVGATTLDVADSESEAGPRD